MIKETYSFAARSDIFSAIGDSSLAYTFIRQAVLQDKTQENFRKEVLSFGDDHIDWLYRTCVDGHLTASALVVNSTCDKVLLIHHRKLGLWLQPGGHADGDGNLGYVAVKEVTEETGLEELQLILPAFDIDVHKIPANTKDPEHLHLDIRFVVKVTGSGTLKPNHETLGAQWVTQNDPKLKDGSLTQKALVALELAKATK